MKFKSAQVKIVLVNAFGSEISSVTSFKTYIN